MTGEEKAVIQEEEEETFERVDGFYLEVEYKGDIHSRLERHNKLFLHVFQMLGKLVSHMLKFYNEQESLPKTVTLWYTITDNFVIQEFQWRIMMCVDFISAFLMIYISAIH